MKKLRIPQLGQAFGFRFLSPPLIVSGKVPEQRDSRQEMRRLEAISDGELGSVG